MDAAADLERTRGLAAALDDENGALRSLLETERRMTATLADLSETRKAESSALRSAIEAKNETISAKDAAIAAQDKVIEALKSKKSSPWRRLGDILIGAAAVLILK